MIHSKLPGVGTTIFSIMSEMANEYNAINLSQGFPNFDISPKLINLVSDYMRKGYNQYSPMSGVMPLREIIAQKTEDLYKSIYNPETEIIVTAGATQALYAIISALIRENDEVIVFEPAYDSYIPAIKMNGGRAVSIKLKAPDYKIDWEVVNQFVNSNTKMMILNSPHNPTGTILSDEDIEKLKRVISGTNITILSDEVYEHIIFDGNQHNSISKYPELAKRSIIVSSFGKTFHATGWKLGYCLAPAEITKEIRKIHQFMVYCANTPIQYAVAEFLQNKEEYLGLGDFYQEKRDFFNNMLKGSKYEIVPSKGTYFQAVDYSQITNMQDKDFAIELTQKHGIASIPMSVFYHSKVESNTLRFCFAKTNETLEKAVERLLKAEQSY